MRSQKVLYWFLQLTAWISLAGIIYLVNKANGVQFSEKSRLALFFFAFLGIAITHSIRFFVLRFQVFSKKSGIGFFLVAASCIFGAFLFQLLYDVIRLALSEKEKLSFSKEFFAQFAVMLLIIIIWVIVYFFFHFIQRNRFQEVENLKLSDSQKSMELRVMRSQLNPHFLFNSLNSIRALISIEPQKAEEGVGKLSNILRSILLLTRKESIPLEEELVFVEDYLDLEKIRFEERLSFIINVDSTLLNIHIPPLIVQSLVENAIKHGISKRKNGGYVRIDISKSQEIVKISVTNSGCLLHGTNSGYGLENIRFRLASFFGEAAHFDLFENEDIVNAIIEIDVKSINC